MKKSVVLLFGLIFILGFVSALNLNTSELECQNAVQYKDQFIGQAIPEDAPFKNEIINIYVSEEIYGNIVLEEKVIIDFSCSESEDPTYNLFIQDFESVKKFVESENYLETYKEMQRSEEIKIKAVGFGRKIKLTFIKFVLKFF